MKVHRDVDFMMNCIKLLKEGVHRIAERERIFVIYEEQLQELTAQLCEASGGLLGEEIKNWVKFTEGDE
jgi:hypothetical protein